MSKFMSEFFKSDPLSYNGDALANDNFEFEDHNDFFQPPIQSPQTQNAQYHQYQRALQEREKIEREIESLCSSGIPRMGVAPGSNYYPPQQQQGNNFPPHLNFPTQPQGGFSPRVGGAGGSPSSGGYDRYGAVGGNSGKMGALPSYGAPFGPGPQSYGGSGAISASRVMPNGPRPAVAPPKYAVSMDAVGNNSRYSVSPPNQYYVPHSVANNNYFQGGNVGANNAAVGKEPRYATHSSQQIQFNNYGGKGNSNKPQQQQAQPPAVPQNPNHPDMPVIKIRGYGNRGAPSGHVIIYQVQFKRGCRHYVPGPRSPTILTVGEFVITQCSRGEDLGVVTEILTMQELVERRFAAKMDGEEEEGNVSHITRVASRYETQQLAKKHADEQAVKDMTTDLAMNKYGLEMNVVDCEFQFDHQKLTIYYTCDERVDFRELVKELCAILKIRIWMKKISLETSFVPKPFATLALATGIPHMP